MELDSYIDLYLSETEENLRLLNRCLLELETGGAGAGLEEAFRAAHTIKGISAMMGFPEVAAVAHTLEDLLDELRSGNREADRALVDELLSAVDLLERTNAIAVRGTTQGSDALVVRVEFEETCILKSARAAIVLRNIEQITQVLGTVPAVLGAEFEGSLQIFVPAGADHDALAAAAGEAGEVATVAVEEMLGSDVAAAIEAAAAAARDETGPRVNGRGADQDGAAAGVSGRRFLRVDAEHLAGLADGVADLGILCGRLESVVTQMADPELAELVGGVRRRISDLEHTAMVARLVPVGEVFHRFPRLVRDTAGPLGKEIDFQMVGQDIEADRRVLEEVSDPLMHLLRNAVDHGLEVPSEREASGKPRRGKLVLRAIHDRTSIRIEIEDDGRGIAADRVVERARALGIYSGSGALGNDEFLRLLSHPGLSTAGEVTGVSGRGVGLDVVVNRIRSLGGAVTLRTEVSRGTTFLLQLPSNLTLTQSLLIRVGGESYAIPLTHVAEVVELTAGSTVVGNGGEALSLREEELPLVRMGEVLGVAEPELEQAAVVIEVGERRFALAVDELVGREQIVVKAFVVAAGTLPIFSGAALLADGRPALVLDPVSVL